MKEGNQNKKQDEKQTEKRKSNKPNQKQRKKGMEAEIRKSTDYNENALPKFGGPGGICTAIGQTTVVPASKSKVRAAENQL